MTNLERHLPMVKTIACQLKENLKSRTPLADLIQAGTIGFHQAIAQFETRHGTTFRMFAQYQIRAAIYKKLLDNANDPERHEIAFHSTINDLMRFYSGSAESTMKRSIHAEIAEVIHLIQCLILAWLLWKGGELEVNSKHTLHAALEEMEDHEKRFIEVVYFEKLPESAVAEKLKISQTSISRTHWKVLQKIRNGLTATSKFAGSFSDKI